MEFQTLIENRRSVRKYSSHTDITKEQIQQLIKAALEAPSWKNTETGRYYCVLSEDLKQKLRKECLCYANNDIKTEHAALIVTTFVHNCAGFQKDGTPDNEIGNGWGCYDLGLQNENLIMGRRNADKIREMLSIPESETIVAVIAVGKADEEPSRPKRRELEDVLKIF